MLQAQPVNVGGEHTVCMTCLSAANADVPKLPESESPPAPGEQNSTSKWTKEKQLRVLLALPRELQGQNALELPQVVFIWTRRMQLGEGSHRKACQLRSSFAVSEHTGRRVSNVYVQK